jgi:transposase
LATLDTKDCVFVEASTPAFAFCDLLKDRVRQVTVIDPFQFRSILDGGKKTDKIDAKKLAEMGKYHWETGQDFLPEVYIVDESIRQLRSLFTTYNLIGKAMTMVRNRIYSLFKQQLKPYTRRQVFTVLRHDPERIDLAPSYKAQVQLLFTILSCLEEQKKALRQAILRTGEPFLDDIDIITSISGISVFTALGLIADYGCIERFAQAKQFSKYLRSTPRSEISNMKRKDGKTHKSGRKFSVKFVLQGMPHVLATSQPMNAFYWRLRKGKGACRARMAVARKLFVIIFYMLKRREYYHHMNPELHQRKMHDYRKLLRHKKGT